MSVCVVFLFFGFGQLDLSVDALHIARLRLRLRVINSNDFVMTPTTTPTTLAPSPSHRPHPMSEALFNVLWLRLRLSVRETCQSTQYQSEDKDRRNNNVNTLDKQAHKRTQSHGERGGGGRRVMALAITIYHHHRVASLGYGVSMWRYERVSMLSARHFMDASIFVRCCTILNDIIGIMQSNKCDIYNV